MLAKEAGKLLASTQISGRLFHDLTVVAKNKAFSIVYPAVYIQWQICKTELIYSASRYETNSSSTLCF